VLRQPRTCGQGLVPARATRTRLARGARVRDRLPRGAVHRRGDVRDVSHDGRAESHPNAPWGWPPGTRPPSTAPCEGSRRVARRSGHARGHAGIRRSARSARCSLRGHVVYGRTTRRLRGTVFRALNGAFEAARDGRIGAAATDDVGLSPGTWAARVGRYAGASNVAGFAGGTRSQATQLTCAL
jgi:hypothetical protein